VFGFRALFPDLGLRLAGVAGLAIGGTAYLLAAVLLGSEEILQLPVLLLRRDRGLKMVTGGPTDGD